MSDDGYFDAEIAASYDRDHGGTDPDLIALTVDTLVDLAAGGPALEFAIGTGRIALPLAARGVDIAGIELSQAMIDNMREKPDGGAIPVTRGDMTTTRVDGAFSLVFLAFNTICNLTTQDAQCACFANAAAHLAPGGAFLVEVGLPPLRRLPPGETRLVFDHSAEHWGLDEFDFASQDFTSHHIWKKDGAVKELSIPMRYVWPSELDLMARLAGLQLERRWADWNRMPFSAESERHISVWRRLSF